MQGAKQNATMKGKRNYLARRRRCVAGLSAFLVVLRWWRCRGSRTAAGALLRPSSSSLLFRHCFFSLFPLLPLSATFFSLYSGVMEVLVLLEAGGGVLAHGTAAPSSGRGATFSVFSHDPPDLLSSSFQLFLPLTVFRSLFFSFGFFVLSSLLCFFYFFGFSPSFSLFFLFLLSGLSLPLFLCFSFFSFRVFLSLLPLSLLLCWLLFIEPSEWLFLMGSSRLVGHGARLPRFGSTRFSGRCVVGQCVRSVGSRREKDRQKNSN